MQKYRDADYFRHCEPCQRTLEVVNTVFADDKPPTRTFFGHSSSLAKLTSPICFLSNTSLNEARGVANSTIV